MEPIALSSTVGRGLVNRAEEAHPIVVDQTDGIVDRVPAPVERAIFAARALTFGSLVLLLAILVVPYVIFKRAGRRKVGLLLNAFNAQPTGPSRDPASRLAWRLSKSPSCSTPQPCISLLNLD